MNSTIEILVQSTLIFCLMSIASLVIPSFFIVLCIYSHYSSQNNNFEICVESHKYLSQSPPEISHMSKSPNYYSPTVVLLLATSDFNSTVLSLDHSISGMLIFASKAHFQKGYWFFFFLECSPCGFSYGLLSYVLWFFPHILNKALHKFLILPRGGGLLNFLDFQSSQHILSPSTNLFYLLSMYY